MRLNKPVLIFASLAASVSALLWHIQGAGAVNDSANEAVQLFISILPQLMLGVIMAGFLAVLIPRDKVARLLGEEAGLRGIIMASVIGAVLPGGPFASFPLVYALFQAGADLGALIAFLVAWATISVNRLVIWEIPFMGFEFGLLRLLSSIPLPIIAGLIARWLSRHHAFFRMPKQ